MLRIAKKLARKSQHRQHHHAVIVTKGSKILATGYNHKFQHAEDDAIRKLETMSVRRDRKLTGLTMYSFRWRKGGTWGNARPCVICWHNITRLNGMYSFSAVYYTDDNGALVKL